MFRSRQKWSQRAGGEHDGDRVAYTAMGQHQFHGRCAEIVIQLSRETDARMSLWHVREQTLQRVTQFLTSCVANSHTSKRRRLHNHKIPREMDVCWKSCALYRTTEKGSQTKRNTCDKELAQPLWSPQLFHRARDVSTFLSPLIEETDIIQTRRSNTANSCIRHHGERWLHC